MSLFRRLTTYLPESVRTDLRRMLHRRQIRKGGFGAWGDPEFHLLPSIVGSGDWVLDIGANVGDYTVRLSELVGPAGRVIAVEPTPGAFELLASNVRALPHANVTLLNVAASDHHHVGKMAVPEWSHGGPNHYRAHITEKPDGFSVLCIPLDSLRITHPVRLVKIDTEGWDNTVLSGIRTLIERDRPYLIVEVLDFQSVQWLEQLGYRVTQDPQSPNLLCTPEAAGRRQRQATP